MNPISIVILSYLCYVKAQSTYGGDAPDVKGDDTCYNPGGGEGRCISLYDCPAVHNVVTKSPKSPEEVAILKQTQCGVDGRTPKVCCPDHYTPADKADACLTPEWRQGKCMELQSCPRISRLFKPPVSMETFIFAKKSTCKGPGKDMQGVCCGVEKEPRSLLNGCKPSTTIPSFESGCCGTESKNGDRIVGGSATSIDQYPWLAVIEYLRDGQVSLRCGGVLINGRYVLTAGHCVLGKVLAAGKPWRVRLAEYDISNDVAEKDCKAANGGGQDCTKGATAIGVDKIIPHPEYIAEHHLKRHDIALLKLKSMAPYTDFIRPICLPTVDHTLKPPENINFSVAGWGATDDNHFKSNIKQHVEVPFMSLDKCQEKISVPLREGQVCAGGEEGKDSCKGDSGGPLTYNNGKTHELVGIVSFGSQQCGQKGVPGVYTRVYEYMPWIKSVIES